MEEAIEHDCAYKAKQFLEEDLDPNTRVKNSTLNDSFLHLAARLESWHCAQVIDRFSQRHKASQCRFLLILKQWWTSETTKARHHSITVESLDLYPLQK